VISVWTDKFSVSNPIAVACNLIKELQTTGKATIDLKMEGPCADHVGLYTLLDTVCEQFNFDPTSITILTSNDEETHHRYQIKIQPRWHIGTLRQYLFTNKITAAQFHNKNFQNLFGCFYNIPSWDRLCILAYVKFNSPHNNILGCNGITQSHCYNTYQIDKLFEFAPNELYNVTKLVNSDLGPLPDHPAPGQSDKPSAPAQLDVLKYYNDFFVDIVGETYIHGLTFYPTEKTWRPILAKTPFLVSGPQGFLDNLRSRYKIQTFAKWWDESYDQYQNYQRIEKIYRVIDQLNSLSLSDLSTMYQEMMPVLEHNFKIFRTLS
jgi:hypothetical protein